MWNPPCEKRVPTTISTNAIYYVYLRGSILIAQRSPRPLITGMSSLLRVQSKPSLNKAPIAVAFSHKASSRMSLTIVDETLAPSGFPA